MRKPGDAVKGVDIMLQIFKRKKTFNVSFVLDKDDSPISLFNKRIAPALIALDNQFEHEKKKIPNLKKLYLKATSGRVFEAQEKAETMVIYMEIGEIDERATKEAINNFIEEI